VETVAEPEGPGKSRRTRAKVVEAAEPVAEASPVEAAPDAGAEEAKPKKPRARKTAAKPEGDGESEA
ncbi:MAG: hypothetical protein ACREEW_07425, partial [Caulobacteraceae bacterium]